MYVFADVRALWVWVSRYLVRVVLEGIADVEDHGSREAYHISVTQILETCLTED
jgi:hypothetical protein